MKFYILTLALLICFSPKEALSMYKHKSINDQRVKTFKVLRIKDTNLYNAHHNQEELDKDLDFKYGNYAFLHKLFLAINDFGYVMPSYLEEKSTYFPGNSHWGEMIGENRITFGGHYDEEGTTLEMNFDEFLRVNNEYQRLCNALSDEIIFRRIGEKVTLEGIWQKN